MAGYIKVYRDMANHPLWLEEQFTRGQAWMDLLFRAAFKDSFFYVRGNKVSVLRGQCAMSQITMSQRWRWSRKKVKKFLNDLESEQMITQQTGQLTTIVTICNYSKYQDKHTSVGTAEVTADDASKGTTEEQQRVHIKEGKEGKESKGTFERPTIERIRNYMIKKGRSLDFAHAQSIKFFDYYESCGWKIGKSGNQMKSWPHAANGWLDRIGPEVSRPSRHVSELCL